MKNALAAGIALLCAVGCLVQNDAHEEHKTGKKDVPVITLKNLSPPYRDFVYFQGSEEYGFEAQATSFSLINAWWLAEASTLAYADEEFAKSRFKTAGMTAVKFFDKQSTQCYVANNERFAIVAFRGSEIWKKRETFDLDKILADLRADVDIRLVDWPQGGKVHRGFKEALDEVWPELRPYIGKLHRRGCSIWITGHSLGGALATLSGSLLDSVQGVYTYGSPWVGNEDFRANIKIKIYRVVNAADIVSRMPTLGVFVHVGEPKFLDRDGILRDKLVDDELPPNQPRAETYGQGSSASPGTGAFKGYIPAPFRDHVPLLYAVHTWNNLVEGRE
jgi:hypothetical protein